MAFLSSRFALAHPPSWKTLKSSQSTRFDRYSCCLSFTPYIFQRTLGSVLCCVASIVVLFAVFRSSVLFKAVVPDFSILMRLHKSTYHYSIHIVLAIPSLPHSMYISYLHSSVSSCSIDPHTTQKLSCLYMRLCDQRSHSSKVFQ